MRLHLQFWGVKMSNSLKLLGLAYVAIGGGLAVLLGASYFVGAYMAGGIVGLLSAPVTWLVIAMPIRGLLWLPSLIVWYFSAAPTGFWQWLAPGLFTYQL